MKDLINFITGTLLTSLVYFLGGCDIALQLLLLAIVLDYVTGIFKAIYKKKLNSEIGLKGIVKKIGYLILVALATMTDRIMGDTGAIRTLVIYFFVAVRLECLNHLFTVCSLDLGHVLHAIPMGRFTRKYFFIRIESEKIAVSACV